MWPLKIDELIDELPYTRSPRHELLISKVWWYELTWLGFIRGIVVVEYWDWVDISYMTIIDMNEACGEVTLRTRHTWWTCETFIESKAYAWRWLLRL